MENDRITGKCKEYVSIDKGWVTTEITYEMIIKCIRCWTVQEVYTYYIHSETFIQVFTSRKPSL